MKARIKARIKATGEIVEVSPYWTEIHTTNSGCYEMTEVELMPDVPDYWTRLEDQYAGMAMQGLMTILPNIGGIEGRTPKDEIVDIATSTSHALVEKLKEKEERK